MILKNITKMVSVLYQSRKIERIIIIIIKDKIKRDEGQLIKF